MVILKKKKIGFVIILKIENKSIKHLSVLIFFKF